MDDDRVTAWVRSISGTLRAGPSRFVGVPTIAFEMWASTDGIVHRMKVPWQHTEYVIPQLRSLVPGIRVTPEDDFPMHQWTRGVEVGLTNSARQLRIFSPADVSASLLASVQALEPGEVVVIQWVVSPAVPEHKPVHSVSKTQEMKWRNMFHGDLASRDEIDDRRAKLDEPNMLAVLRVAAKAKTDVRADHLIYRVKAALASTRGPATKFVKRFVSDHRLQERIRNASGSLYFPMQLSAKELTALIAWPIGNPNVPGLPAPLSRHLPPTEAVPSIGRVIGRSTFPGAERPVAIGYVDALKHVHVSGPTGSGKTVLLANMLKQDIENGYGVVLIESKGDLFQSALDYIPPSRIQDTIVLDVNDTKRPVGFNLLRQGDPRVVIDEIQMLFEHMYEAKSVWTREVLYHGLRTLASDPNLTFVDLAPLLVPTTAEDGEWRDELIRNLRDPELRSFWQRLDNQPRTAQDRITQPVMDRIWQLNARPEIRNIIGQSDSSFQMDDVIRGNKILLVNLAGLPRETASLVGTLLMNSLWHSVKSTAGNRSNFLYLDEFQSFLNLPVDPEDMLAKARGFGLGMTLAHQHLGQLPSELKQAVLANARSKIVFQTSAEDARAMSREFGASVDDKDFMHLSQYEVLARVASSGGVSSPFTVSTTAPAKGYNRAKHVVFESRQAYGRPVGLVEKQMADRRTKPPARTSSRRPRVSSWDDPPSSQPRTGS